MPLRDQDAYREYMREYMARTRAEKRLTVNPPVNPITSKVRGLTTPGLTALVNPTSEAPQIPPHSAPTCPGGVIPTTPTTSTHAFSIRANFTGSTPISNQSRKEGNYGNIEVQPFSYTNFNVIVYKQSLALVCKEGYELTGNHADKEKVVAGWRKILQNFCTHWKITLSNVREGEWSDHPFEDPSINAVLVAWVKQHGGNFGNRQVYLQTDKSHPDQVEIKGQASWEAEQGAEYLFRVFPKQMVQMMGAIGLYTAQIQEHLAAIKEIRTGLGEMNVAIKELRDAIKEMKR